MRAGPGPAIKLIGKGSKIMKLPRQPDHGLPEPAGHTPILYGGQLATRCEICDDYKVLGCRCGWRADPMSHEPGSPDYLAHLRSSGAKV
jgi:hypothetical protein